MRIIKNYSNFPVELQGGVVALGNFDGVHLGHQKVIGEAITMAQKHNITSTVVTFNPHPITIVKPERNLLKINTLHTKYKLMENLGLDTLCVISFDKAFSQMPAEDFITKILHESLGVKHIVIGHDFIFGRGRGGNAELLREYGKTYGYQLHQVTAEKNNDIICSSTKIRCFLQGGEIEKANEMLGYNYIIEGEVISGRKLGRELGFPTANIRVENNMVPLFGVYAVSIKIAGEDASLHGIANLGIKPTFDEVEPLLEVNIFDFDQDIYGKHVTIELLKYIRPEKKFNDIEELKSQIACDVMSVKNQI